MSLYRHTIHGFFALFQKPTGSHTYLLRQEDLKEEANVEIEEETLKEENLIVKQEKKDNKGIYAIAGVSAIVVIGGVIAVVKSKKK